MLDPNFEADIQTVFDDHAGDDSETTITGLLAIAEKIGRDLIRVDCANVDKIADAVGSILARILAAHDIRQVPDFIEMPAEAFAVRLVVAQIKDFGHKYCEQHNNQAGSIGS